MKNPFGDMSNILKQAKAMQDQMARIQEQAATLVDPLRRLARRQQLFKGLQRRCTAPVPDGVGHFPCGFRTPAPDEHGEQPSYYTGLVAVISSPITDDRVLIINVDKLDDAR